ncbi:MAG TPA: VWA domain-containing protein [Vicinamibacteria bacterium]
MKRLPLAFAVVTALAGLPSGRAQEPPPEPPPTFPGDVELVTVDVVVTDKNGRPVNGLAASDFVVEEEGRPQSVLRFEAVDLPPLPSQGPARRPRVSTNQVPRQSASRTFLILFDDLHITHEDAQQAKGAVATFLRRGVRDGDFVSLLATSGEAWWSTRMEAGRQDLLLVLGRLEGRRLPEKRLDSLSDWEAMRIAHYNDTIVGDRVLRRFQTLRIMPDNAFPSSRIDGVRSSREEDSTLYQRGINDLMVESRASEIYSNVRIRGARTLSVMERALESLSAAKGRKSLILVSDGFVLDTTLDGFQKVVQAARRSNVAIYFVNTRGLRGLVGLYGADMAEPVASRDTGAVMADITQEAAGSEHLSEDTGGFVIRNTNDLEGGVERIARESLSYYLLGYNPAGTPRDGSYRRIAVRVPGKEGLVIRARRGYYAPRDGDPAAPGPAERKDADMQRALDSPYYAAEIPARMSAYVRDEVVSERARTLLAAEIDVSDLTFESRGDGRRVGTLNLLFTVAHRDSSDTQREDKEVEIVLRPGPAETTERVWYAVNREFQLAPGGYQAKLVIRDAGSRRVGTVTHDFEVPSLEGWRVSTPALSDTLQAQDPGTPPAPMLLARREFASGEPLLCQFDVYGATKGQATGMPQVSAGYALVGADGRAVLEGEPTAIRPTSLGFLSRLWVIGLAGVAPGNYELVIVVRDEVAGREEVLREPLTVTPPATERSARR